jgi:prevent-host-death family protein
MTKSAAEGVLHVGVHEAKTQLSRLLDRVLAGQDVVIDRRGVPVARLTRVEAEGAPVFGSDRGAVVIGDDFDAPLPAEVADALGS